MSIGLYFKSRNMTIQFGSMNVFICAASLLLAQVNLVQCGGVSGSDDDRGCRQDDTTLSVCSARGRCVSGVCECFKRSNPQEVITGKYCECDNYSCQRAEGLLCGGNGICECGYCMCKPGWTGEDCSCSTSTDSCMPEPGMEICSGHGQCICNACKCEQTREGRYSRKYCEKCPTCSSRCFEFKECVQCQMYKTGPLSNNAEDCIRNCTNFVPLTVDVIEANEEKGDRSCAFYDENDCRFEFMYNDNDENDIKVSAKDELDCPKPAFSFFSDLYQKVKTTIF